MTTIVLILNSVFLLFSISGKHHTSLTAARNSLCVGHRLREPASTFQAYESLTNCSQRTTKITHIQRTCYASSSRRSELTDRDLIPLIDRTIFFVLHNRWWCCRQCHRCCRSRLPFVIAADFACVIVFADTLGRERRTRSCVFRPRRSGLHRAQQNKTLSSTSSASEKIMCVHSICA